MLLAIVSRLGARALSAAIQAVFLIGVARILGAVSFGELAVGLSAGAVVGAAMNLGLNVHLLRVGLSREADAQIGASLFAVVWLSGMSIAVVVAAGVGIFAAGGLFAAGVVLAGAEIASESVVSAVSGRETHSFASALIVGRRLASVGVFVLSNLAGVPPAYSIVLMSTPMFAMAVSSFFVPRFAVFRRSIVRDAFAAIRAARDAWGTTIAAQVSQLDTILVSVVLGRGAAGVYAAAVRATLPLNLIVGSVLAIFVPRLARARDASEWRPASRSVRRIAALLSLCLALSAPAYGWLTSYALGSSFDAAAHIVSWIVVGVAVSVGSQVLQAEFLTTVGGTYPAVVIASVSALGLVALVAVAHVFGLQALGLAMAGSQAAILLLLMRGRHRVDAHLGSA